MEGLFLCRVNDGQSFIDSFIDSLIHLSALSSKSYHIIIISYRFHLSRAFREMRRTSSFLPMAPQIFMHKNKLMCYVLMSFGCGHRAS